LLRGHDWYINEPSALLGHSFKNTCLPVLFILCPLENVALSLLMTGDSVISKDKEISDEERIREMRGGAGQRASLKG